MDTVKWTLRAFMWTLNTCEWPKLRHRFKALSWLRSWASSLSSILTVSSPKTSLNVISLPYRTNKRTSPNKIVVGPQAERWKNCVSTPGKGKNFLSPNFGARPAFYSVGYDFSSSSSSSSSSFSPPSLILYSPLWTLASSTTFLHSRRFLTNVCLCFIPITRGSFKIFPESLYFWDTQNSTIIQPTFPSQYFPCATICFCQRL